MKEPRLVDYPQTPEGAAEFALDMQLWQTVQRNNLRAQKRDEAARLLAMNDAIKPLPGDAAVGISSGVPGSRDAEIATPMTDALYAALGVGAKFVAPVQGLLGTVSRNLQTSFTGAPDAVQAPVAKFFDRAAQGAEIGRSRANQFAEGVDRYLAARKMMREQEGGGVKFDLPRAILTGGEAAKQLVGGPTAQALLAYGEKDDPFDAAIDLAAGKLSGRVVPRSVAQGDIRRRLADALFENAMQQIPRDPGGMK